MNTPATPEVDCEQQHAALPVSDVLMAVDFYTKKITLTLRTMLKRGGVLGLAFVLSGCALSVDPVVPESAAVIDPRLLGTWEEVSGSDLAVVSRAAGNAYAIEYTSDG